MAAEGRETLAAQLELAPKQFEAYRDLAPQYDEVDIQRLGRSLFGADYQGGRGLLDVNADITARSAQQNRDANTAQRAADVADAQQYGSQVQGLVRELNPDLYRAIDMMGQRAGQPTLGSAAERQLGNMAFAGTPTTSIRDVGTGTVRAPRGDAALGFAERQALQAPTGPGTLQTRLEAQAADELARGGDLSGDELRRIQQDTRGAYAARGLYDSNQAIGAEILNTDSARRGRLNEARSFASGVDQQGFGQRQTAAANAIGNALGVSGARQGYAGQGLQAQLANQATGLAAQSTNQQADLARNQLGLAGQAQQFGQLQAAAGLEAGRRQEDVANQNRYLGALQSTQFDPFQGVLGRQSVNQGTNAALMGSGQGITSANSATTQGMFNPWNSYSSDLYNTNFNAQANANIATANNNAALMSAGIGAVGSAL